MLKNNSSTEIFFDKVANNYDVLSVQANNSYLVEAKKIFANYCYKDGSILDVGCGTGLLSETLGDNFTYVGIDISSQMLRKCSERKYQMTIHRSIDEALPLLENYSYDFVVSLGVLYYVKNVQAVIQQMMRIARKAVLFDLCNIPLEFIQKSPRSLYNHSQISIPNALEDYVIFGWKSPTQGTEVTTRMILITKE